MGLSGLLLNFLVLIRLISPKDYMALDPRLAGPDLSSLKLTSSSGEKYPSIYSFSSMSWLTFSMEIF
jgi:hypothetical protein